MEEEVVMEPVEVPEHIQKAINEDVSSSTESETKSEDGKEDGGQGSGSEDWTELDKDGWENVLGSGRLRRRIITAAEDQGVGPRKGDYVKVSFKGVFEGTTFEENDAFEFNCEEGEAIRALELVVALMHPGETDEIIADPELAYGDFGLPPHLPPKGAVKYEMTLIEHKPAVPSPHDYELDDRKNIGLRKKDRGNFWFSRSQYSQAVQCYRKAVEYFDDEKIQLEVSMERYTLEQPLQDLITEKIKAYNNLAQSQIKLEAYDTALASLKNVLKLDPNNEKALFRKAKALAEKGEIDIAVGTLRRVVRLYKDNKLAQSELQRLLSKQNQYNQSQKNMSKKMLQLDKYEEEKKAAEAKKKADEWRLKTKAIILTAMIGGIGIFYAWFNNN